METININIITDRDIENMNLIIDMLNNNQIVLPKEIDSKLIANNFESIITDFIF